MNINSLVKNNFIIAIPVAILLVICLKKFNEFRTMNNESKEEGDINEEDKPSYDIKYYLKSLVICYLLGIVFVILIKKGYNYYTNGIKLDNNTEGTLSQVKELIENTTPLFKKEEAIVKRETELKNDIKDLNVDIDTSNLETIEIPSSQLKQSNVVNEKPTSSPELESTIKTSKILEPPSYTNENTLETKKKMLLEKKKKLLALKNQQKKPKKIEQFQTGTPNF